MVEEFDITTRRGETLHVKKENIGDHKYRVTIERRSPSREQCDPITGKCSFGTQFKGCSCEPWNCPERFEQWVKRHDADMEKLYNITPSQRDLSFLKARLAHRCATNHSNRGNRKLDEEDVGMVTQIKRRELAARKRQETANFEKNENSRKPKPRSAEEALLLDRMRKRVKENAGKRR